MPLDTANRVIHWETHRGRNSEFDKVEAGTASITLMNRDGLFDPLNASSPYVTPDLLLPLRQVRITANTPADPGVYHDIFTGYVEGWNYQRTSPRGALAFLDAVDGFELLQQAEVLPVAGSGQGGQYFAEQHVDSRVLAALGFAGWPASRASVFSGNTALQAVTYPKGTSMLQVIQEAVDAEFPALANFYMDRSGRACFRGRYFRFDPESDEWDLPGAPYFSVPANRWKFADADAFEAFDGEAPTGGPLIPMADCQWTFDRERVYNVVTCTVAGQPAKTENLQTVTDTASRTKYGRRTLTIPNLILLAGMIPGPGTEVVLAREEAKRYATYFVENYNEPIVRASSIEIHSKFEDDNVWDFLVNVELGDLAELYTVNPGSGGFNGQEFFIDGIHNSVDAEGTWPSWVSNYDLTPKANFGNFPPPPE